MTSNAPVRRVILDTDLAMGEGANIDDGFALALAHADPLIQLDMITTVHGNTDVQSATVLTMLLAEQLGAADVPIHRGAATPLTRTNLHRTPSDYVLKLWKSKFSKQALPTTTAAVAIVNHVMTHPGEITIVAIGPLTNIALALLLEPRLATALNELVIMGGSFFGHTNLWAKPGETNVFTDPEAGQAVLRSGVRQRWIGLDVTLQTRLTRARATELEQSDSPFASFAGKSANAYIDVLADRYPGRPIPDSCPVHDALAVAAVTLPDVCTFRDAAVSVVTGEGKAKGMVLADTLEGVSPPTPNCKIAVDVDTELFDRHFYGLIQSL